VRGVVHYQVERPARKVAIDQIAERGCIGLIDGVVHVDTIAEAALGDQRVEGGHPLLAQLHRHEHIGTRRHGHEGAASPLEDPELHDRGRLQIGQQRQIGHHQIGTLDQTEAITGRREALGRPPGDELNAIDLEDLLVSPNGASGEIRSRTG
jgi:hypothetical protein